MSSYVNYNRKVIRGDSEKFQVRFTNTEVVNGKSICAPINITGWNIRFTVRNTIPDVTVTDDTDAVISVQGNIKDASKGIAEIFVPSEKTMLLQPGDYLYDIQFSKPLDTLGNYQVRSLYKAKYTVLSDITRYNYTYEPEDDETSLDYNKVTVPAYYTFEDEIDDSDGGYDIG